jgi:hypothetical protein
MSSDAFLAPLKSILIPAQRDSSRSGKDEND